jgi:hypothetical protein
MGPIIATDVGGIPHIVNLGALRFILPDSSPGDLARALLVCLTSQGGFAGLQENVAPTTQCKLASIRQKFAEKARSRLARGDRLCADAFLLPTKSGPMTFCRGIATISDHDASGRFELAQIGAPSRSGLKWVTR